ncbi:MAG: hypothetical protein ABIH25_03515 [Candidatus Woesearchaeota archaeon]
MNETIHFWELKNKKNYISLNDKFLNKILPKLWNYSQDKIKEITGVSNSVIGRIRRKERSSIRIDQLLKLNRITNFKLEEIERNIIWIGAPNSQGLINPKLPFNFNTRQGARFLAAICNEGWISDGAYYSNTSQELRNSVIKDTLAIFGGEKSAIRVWVKEKDEYLAFPSIIRDCLLIITNFKGIKSENNPEIPKFILKNEELTLGWIEQTIADEGCVKYYPETYRREITWKRAFSKTLSSYKLIEDEMRILNNLKINYTIHNTENYQTKKKKLKTNVKIRIGSREELLKLRKLIKIPLKRKDDTFTIATKSFVRYKEKINIKNIIIKICKEKGFTDSPELKKRMKYKKINTAIKWLNHFSNLGILKCIKRSHYAMGSIGPIPAKYSLKETQQL